MLFTACVRVYFIRLCSFLNNRIKQNLIVRLLNEEIVILKIYALVPNRVKLTIPGIMPFGQPTIRILASLHKTG